VTSTLSATGRRWVASTDRIVDKYFAIIWAAFRSWLWRAVRDSGSRVMKVLFPEENMILLDYPHNNHVFHKCGLTCSLWTLYDVGRI